MEFKQLEAFVKVYELQSFSRAAQALFLSQPSVSAHIIALEARLETKLLYRSVKSMAPTKAGILFYEYAKELLSLRSKTLKSIASLSDGTKGTVDILASSVPAQQILPEVIGAFHKVYPNILFNVIQADTSEVVQGIAAYQSEIGFVGSLLENPKCAFSELTSEKLVLIAPYEERFENISGEDIKSLLRDEYFVMREVGSGTRIEYSEYLESVGIRLGELKVSACFDNTQSILGAVASGLGLSIVSELAARSYILQRMVIPISVSTLPKRHFYAVVNKSGVLTAATEGFLKFVRAYLSGQYPGNPS